MLTDVLGTIVAFITVILLLSILVTALVQASAAVLGLRGRNLLWGVTRAIQHLDAIAADQPGARPANSDAKGAKKRAVRALNDPSIALMYHVADPSQGKGRVWRFLRGPGISWVDSADLVRVIAAPRRQAGAGIGRQASVVMPPPQSGQMVKGISSPSGEEAGISGISITKASPDDPDEKTVEAAKRAVSLMEKQTSKRFALEMRVLALIWSLVVAIGFQVSAPKLLVDLSNDSVRRERILAESKVLLGREQQTLAVLNSETYGSAAVVELAKRFPKYQQEFEQLSGVGTNREFVLEELRLVLKEAPNREEIARAYGELLDAAAEKQMRALSAQFGESLSTLAGFDIRFWRDNKFFFDGSKVHFDAIIGALLTAILLSFGAPFWFQMLREAASLRDRLMPTRPVAKTTTTVMTTEQQTSSNA